ncbi:Cdt1-like protein b [Thalictrum thalictroides]|uniref:Cdt1-like protein b n=1 Tax=Thalictrum thalictroides TaxID=46969 RepID=A0A7J6V744_THATH|nr:Cdt1-like protein b [Thalictrum thalictroides]
MEPQSYEDNTQKLLESKSETISSDVKDETASSHASVKGQTNDERKGLLDNLASPTPEKTIRTPWRKNKQIALSVRTVMLSKEDENNFCAVGDESDELPDGIAGCEEKNISDAMTEVERVEIPDKYKPLAELFDRIDTSVRLLNLQKKLPTYQNICTVVKVLTKRTLSYNHLAQMKYVLPEAIHIEKILQHDEKTLCMMPDMKITFRLDVIKALPNQSVFMALRQVFHERLLCFFNSNSENCEIPQAMLPEPFSQRNHSVLPRPPSLNSLVESHTAPIECEPLLASSVVKCIGKHFSQKKTIPETEKTQLLSSLAPLFPLNVSDETDLYTRMQKQIENSPVSKSSSTTSPAALIINSQCSNSSVNESPPLKLASLTHPLTLETPVQPTPAKRFPLLSSCEKMDIDTRTMSHTAAKRSLTFDELDSSLHTAAAKDSLVDIIASPSASTQLVQESRNWLNNKSGLAKRQHLLVSLLDLITTIESIFKSANGSLVTKQELLHKIITYNLDIVDIREVEGQLELLEELAPDWIVRKLVPTGDLLYSIRGVSDLESISARLSEAV